MFFFATYPATCPQPQATICPQPPFARGQAGYERYRMKRVKSNYSLFINYLQHPLSAPKVFLHIRDAFFHFLDKADEMFMFVVANIRVKNKLATPKSILFLENISLYCLTKNQQAMPSVCSSLAGLFLI